MTPKIFPSLSLALILLTFSVSAGPPSFQNQRTVTVEEAGWVKVPLPLDLLLKLSSSATDWRLIDPAGKPFPAKIWLGPPKPLATSHEAKVFNIKTVPGGWLIEADLGPGDLRHRRTIVQLPGTGLAENVSLEGSDDGLQWNLLTKGAFFRLTPRSHIEKTWLSYEPSHMRFLRLFWPTKAGRPHWKSIRVEDWPDNTIFRVEQPLPYVSEGRVEGEETFRVTLPTFFMKNAVLGVKASLSYPVRVTLLKAMDGYWKVVSEAVLSPDQNKGLFLPERLTEGPFKMVIDSGGFPLPDIQGFYLRFPPRALLFRAEGPGVYLLKYGGAPGWAAPKGIPGNLMVPDTVDQLAILGPEKKIPLPDLPTPSLGLGGALPEVTFSHRWVVSGGQTPPGKLVSIPLPPDLYSSARGDLGDVRLVVHDRQVPYLLKSPVEGVEVLNHRNVKPIKGEEPGSSVIPFSVKYSHLPVTAITLTTPSFPFSRPIILQGQYPVKDRHERVKYVWKNVSSLRWNCPGISELPARLFLSIQPSIATHFRILIFDGDNAPLTSVTLQMWRKKHLLTSY